MGLQEFNSLLMLSDKNRYICFINFYQALPANDDLNFRHKQLKFP